MPDWMGDGDIAFPNLGIYLENVPKSFTIFGFEIALYGLIIGVGVVLAFMLMAKQAVKEGLKADDVYDVGIWVVICGIIGARLYYVIFSWDYYKDNLLSILNLRQGGLAIYGGLIGGFIALIFICKKKNINIYKMGDVAFQGALVGQILGRWGNFTNREVFGGYTDNLFAMRLPIAAVRNRDISDDLAAHVLPNTNYIQVHPTFLYESVYNLVLLVLIVIFQKKRAFDGEIILWYASGYGIGRAVIEGIRTDRLTIGNTGLAVSQLLGILLFFAGIILDIIIRIRILRKNSSSKTNTGEGEK